MQWIQVADADGSSPQKSRGGTLQQEIPAGPHRLSMKAVGRSEVQGEIEMTGKPLDLDCAAQKDGKVLCSEVGGKRTWTLAPPG